MTRSRTGLEKTSEFSTGQFVKGRFLYGTEVFAGRRVSVLQAAARLRGLIRRTGGRKRADKGKGVACRLRGKIFRLFHLFTGSPTSPASL